MNAQYKGGGIQNTRGEIYIIQWRGRLNTKKMNTAYKMKRDTEHKGKEIQNIPTKRATECKGRQVQNTKWEGCTITDAAYKVRG